MWSNVGCLFTINRERNYNGPTTRKQKKWTYNQKTKNTSDDKSYDGSGFLDLGMFV